MARLAIRATGGERERITTHQSEIRADITVANKKVAHMTVWGKTSLDDGCAVLRIEKLSRDVRILVIDRTSETEYHTCNVCGNDNIIKRGSDDNIIKEWCHHCKN